MALRELPGLSEVLFFQMEIWSIKNICDGHFFNKYLRPIIFCDFYWQCSHNIGILIYAIHTYFGNVVI